VCVMVTQTPPTTVVGGGGGLNKYQGPAADALQRPLRSRFQARLTAGVRRCQMINMLLVPLLFRRA
jgi:hypothetical protein